MFRMFCYNFLLLTEPELSQKKGSAGLLKPSASEKSQLEKHWQKAKSPQNKLPEVTE